MPPGAVLEVVFGCWSAALRTGRSVLLPPSTIRGDGGQHGPRDLERAALMPKLTEEATAEAFGASKKKWALVVVAFLAGAVVVLRLQRRPEEKELDARPDGATDGATDESPPDGAESDESLRTRMQNSNQKVREDLQRWAQLPMKRLRSGGDSGGSPP